MNPARIVFIVLGQDGSVRGFAYTTQKWALEGAKEADSDWPAAAPHKVVEYGPVAK